VPSHRSLTALGIVLSSCSLLFAAPFGGSTAAISRSDRWQGHEWVFVFSSDDGHVHNCGWAEVADSLDFAFTIYVNQWTTEHPGASACFYATADELRELAAGGNEIGQHGYAHGTWGLDLSGDCGGPWGGFPNFWDPNCYPPGIGFEEAMENFLVEVAPESLEHWLGVSPQTAAYPAHLHSDSCMYHLERLGYLGARDGGIGWNSSDFEVPPQNSWEEGISLYRVPLMTTTATLWGDHWNQGGDVAQHFSEETFRAKFDSVLAVNQVIEDGKIFCLYAHDFGADDDRYCDRDWHTGGLTPEELAATVTYARERGAAVMTFAEAMAWYRAHAVRIEDPAAVYGPGYAGDIVWRVQEPTDVPARPAGQLLAQNQPNPFNPATEIRYLVPAAGRVSLRIYDVSGRLIRTLFAGSQEAGSHLATWDGLDAGRRSVPSGIYYYQLLAGHRRETRKMTLIR
jgi:hypothetical protein